MRYGFKKIQAFTLLTIGAFLFSSYSPIVVAALTDDELNAIYSDTTFYDPNGCSTTDASGSVIGGLEGTNKDNSVYKSGLQPPYILEQFMIHILKRLAQKYNMPESNFLTEEHVVALIAFAYGEGGDINNPSLFNPMNTAYDDDDVGGSPWDGDSTDGTQGYPSFDQGVEAYARQLSSGYQSRLGFVLSKPNSTGEQFMEALTYFKRYEGNAVWATASLDDPAEYYRTRVLLINTVRQNYGGIAGLVIGTPAYEQIENITRPELITYKNLLNGDNQNGTGNLPSTTDPCTTDSSVTGGNQAIAEVALREYEENKGIREYGGDILTYSQNVREAWCADFVSWVYKDSGNPLTKGIDSGAWRHNSVSELQSYMKKHHEYFEVGDNDPQPGDIAFYIGTQTPDGGSTSHVNIVVSVDIKSQTMVTVGGNESDQVQKTTRNIALGESALVGFGRLTQ